MINILPPLFGLHPTASQTNGAVGGDIYDQAKASDSLSQNQFSQLLREQTEIPFLFKSLQLPGSISEQRQSTQLALLTQKANLQSLVSPDTLNEGYEKLSPEFLSEPLTFLQSPTEPAPVVTEAVSGLNAEELEDAPLRFPVEEGKTFQAGQALLNVQPKAGPTENRAKEISNVSIPSVSLSPLVLEGQPHLAGFPQAGVTGVDPVHAASLASSHTSQKVANLRDYPISGSGQGPIQAGIRGHILESEVASQQVVQSGGKEHAQANTTLEKEPFLGSFLVPGKDGARGLERVLKSVQDQDVPQLPPSQRPVSGITGPRVVVTNTAPPVTVQIDQGPAGFTETVSPPTPTVKPVLGPTSSLSIFPPSGGSNNRIEPSIAVPVDLFAESSLLAKGERGQSLVESAVKSVGMDSSAGQGLSQGMNHFPQSQTGKQQAAFSHGQFAGGRISEERGLEFPAQTLQRLQMDVQLSENNRVHIDVGVQQKHVYAGLIMDHSMLRNLAVQSVPQLENQLAQVDMELEEFSAEVREQQEQEAQTPFEKSRTPHRSGPIHTLPGETVARSNSVSHSKEQGLHFVA